MGVKGLLPCLRSIAKPTSLEKYRGLTVGVDAMCWIHKGLFAADVRSLAKAQFSERDEDQIHQEKKKSHNIFEQRNIKNDSTGTTVVKKLIFDKRPPQNVQEYSSRQDQQQILERSDSSSASKCIDYVIRHTLSLKSRYGIDILLVIDGGQLPAKDAINRSRRAERSEAYEKAIQEERKGRNREARKLFGRACSITHEMRHQLILECRKKGISFVVAPYEADAQLAKLAHSCAVDVIISEDSDLLAYGCPRVLFKLDLKTGEGDEIQILKDLASNESLSFRNWNHDMFLYMCILAGCDYCEGVQGVGIQTAHKYVRVHRTPKKIFNALRAVGKLSHGFVNSFWVAYRTFRHQRIFCTEKKGIDTLFPIQEVSNEESEWKFLGEGMEPSIAEGIANGDIHPDKKVPWNEITSIRENHTANHCTDRNLERRNANLSSSAQQIIRKSPLKEHVFHKRDDSKEKCRSIDNDLFAFGRGKLKTKGEKELHSEQIRPPLQEIEINDQQQSSMEDEKDRQQPIPFHFHEYSSRLVGNTFKPLSRINKNGIGYKRKVISKSIRGLKNKVMKRHLKQNDSIEKETSSYRTDCIGLDLKEESCCINTNNHNIHEIENNLFNELENRKNDLSCVDEKLRVDTSQRGDHKNIMSMENFESLAQDDERDRYYQSIEANKYKKRMNHEDSMKGTSIFEVPFSSHSQSFVHDFSEKDHTDLLQSDNNIMATESNCDFDHNNVMTRIGTKFQVGVNIIDTGGKVEIDDFENQTKLRESFEARGFGNIEFDHTMKDQCHPPQSQLFRSKQIPRQNGHFGDEHYNYGKEQDLNKGSREFVKRTTEYETRDRYDNFQVLDQIHQGQSSILMDQGLEQRNEQELECFEYNATTSMAQPDEGLLEQIDIFQRL